MSRLGAWRQHRADTLDHSATGELVADRWRWTLQGTAAARTVTSGSGAPTTVVPAVTAVDLSGDTITLVVRLLAGQLATDLLAVGDRIADGMGVRSIRVQPFRPGWCRVALLLTDPLDTILPLPVSELSADEVLIGCAENGIEVRVAPADMPHMIVQGQTRSGKSTWLYGLLAQLVRHSHLEVAGVDPSGITLRPFAGTVHAPRIALGLGDLAAVEAVLSQLVTDMDARLAAMPLDRDILPIDETWPLRIVVLEEWPGVLRAFDATTTGTGKRVRALVARLLAESHKVGYRIVLAAQRAEATIIGGAERAQCGGRLSFRVDGLDSVKLLHSDAEDLAPAHASAEPGIALCSWPGRPLTRIRAPFLGGYREFRDAVGVSDALCPGIS